MSEPIPLESVDLAWIAAGSVGVLMGLLAVVLGTSSAVGTVLLAGLFGGGGAWVTWQGAQPLYRRRRLVLADHALQMMEAENVIVGQVPWTNIVRVEAKSDRVCIAVDQADDVDTWWVAEAWTAGRATIWFDRPADLASRIEAALKAR